jgi:hypothetical protein
MAFTCTATMKSSVQTTVSEKQKKLVLVATPVILATQEVTLGGSRFKANPRQTVWESLSWKYPTQKALAEWLMWQSSCLTKHGILSSKFIVFRIKVYCNWVKIPSVQKIQCLGKSKSRNEYCRREKRTKCNNVNFFKRNCERRWRQW